MKEIGLALFTYCRPHHTKKVIESIEKNGFKKVHIFQDGLKSSKDEQSWNEVNSIIKNITSFETVLHISETNKGLANSIIRGMNYMFEKYDFAIALEDDVVLGGGYREYVQYCMEKYIEKNDVVCIAGGGWPVKIPDDYKYDVFFSYRSSSIAWGTWKDRWAKYQRDFRLLGNIIKDEGKNLILQKSGSDIYGIMQNQLVGKSDSWAVFWTLMQINSKGVCAIPTKYLAKDIGHDGVHGTNSLYRTTRFDTELYDLSNSKLKLPDDIEICDDIIRQISMVLNCPLKEVRLGFYNQIMNKWILCLQKKSSFEKYFKVHNIESVYIYGAGDIAELLINQISECTKIKGVIVHDKNKEELCGYKIYDFSDNLNLEFENIIVTPIHDIEYIEYSVHNRFGNQNLINILNMIDDIYLNY